MRHLAEWIKKVEDGDLGDTPEEVACNTLIDFLVDSDFPEKSRALDIINSLRNRVSEQ